MVAAIPYRIDQMVLLLPKDGHLLAFTTGSRSGRIESSVPYGIYVIDLPNGGAPRLVLHTHRSPDPWTSACDAWSLDSRQIFFSYGFGTPEGPIEFRSEPSLHGVHAGEEIHSMGFIVRRQSGKPARWRPVAVLSGPRASAQKLNLTSC